MALFLATLGAYLLALATAASGAALNLARTDHSAWTGLLREFVDDQSRVDYARLQQEAVPRLDAYLSDLARPGSEPLTPDDQKAFLINAYNALTVRWILSHYPAESIWSTPDPFKEPRHVLGGRRISLDEIETLLRDTGDARIHAVLVCAARSCPPLRQEAYAGERIDEQLDDNSRRWLSNPESNRFQPATAQAQVSSIFKWYHADFASHRGGLDGFLKEYAPPQVRETLADRSLKITYLDYNWGLNDQSDLGTGYSWFGLAKDWLRNLFR